MNRSKEVTEGALLTAVYIILILIVLFVPLIQLFGIFVLPVPFAIYTARNSWKPGVIMAMVALLLTMVFATVVSLPLTLFASLGGMVIGQGIYKKKNAYEIWARGTVGYIFSFVIILVILQFLFSINIFTEINTLIDDMMAMMESAISQLQLDGDIASQLDVLEEQMRQLPDLLPASLGIMSILFALITQWVSYKIISRVEQKKEGFPPFKQLNLPVSVIWIYFITLLISFFDLEPGSTLDVVILNTMALLSVLLVIQGLSFIFFFADYKNIHQAVPIGVVVVTLLVPFIFMFLIEITGIIDLGFSLKKRISQDKT